MNLDDHTQRKRNDDPRFPDACNRIIRSTTPGLTYKELENDKPEKLTKTEIQQALTALEHIEDDAKDDLNQFDVLAAIHYSLNDRKKEETFFLRTRFLHQLQRVYIDRFLGSGTK